MKKLLFSVFVCLLASTAIQAQVGIRVGAFAQPQGAWTYNQNWLDADNNYAPLPIYRTAFGLDLGYNLKDHLGIRANITYNQLGVRNEDKETGLTSSNLLVGGIGTPGNDKVLRTDFQTSYLSTPVMLRLNSSPLSNVVSHFDLALTPSFLVGAKGRSQKAGESWEKSDSKANTEFKKQVSSFDFAIGIGVGVDVKLAENLFLNLSILRINYSITDAFKSQDKNSPFAWYRDGKDNATQIPPTINATPDSRKYHNITIGSQVGIVYILEVGQ